MLRKIAAILMLCCVASAQSVVRQIDAPANVTSFGMDVAGVDDLNGDGLGDIAVAGFDVLSGQGIVRFHDSLTGALLFGVSTPFNAFGFPKMRLLRFADVTGDGIDEVAFSLFETSSFTGFAVVRLLNGANGAPLWTLSPPVAGQEFGAALARLDDWDGDGVAEIAVGYPKPQGGNGQVRIYSGLTGALLFTRAPTTLGLAAGFGASLATIDWDGDGDLDLAVGAPNDHPPYATFGNAGSLRVMTVDTGANLAGFEGPGNLSRFGAAVVNLGDVNNDGTDDLCVSAPNALLINNDPILTLLAGGIVLANNNPQILSSIHAPLAPGDGLDLASVQDVDRDGIADVAVSNGTSGTTRILSGFDLAQIGSVNLGTNPANPTNAVGALSDLNGDGAGECLIGHPAGGNVLVVSVEDLTASVVTVGPGVAPGVVPQVASTTPTLGNFFTVSVSGTASETGTLLIAPGPANPLIIGSGITIYPDFTFFSEWILWPVLLNPGGSANIQLGLPEDVRIAGMKATMQAWFPSSTGIASSAFTNGIELTFGY